MSFRTVTAAALTVVLWASAFVAIRVALPDIGAPALSGSRLVLAVVALLVAAPVLRIGLPPRQSLVRVVGCGAAGMSAYQLLLNSGELTVQAGTAALLMGTAPLFAAALARPVLGERVTARSGLGMAIGFSGATVIALGSGDGLRLDRGALLVLAAALAQATFFVLQKQLLARHTAAEVTCWSMVAGALLLLPLAPATVQSWRGLAHPAGALAAVGYLALGASALGFLAWAYAQARLSVAAAAGTLYAVPAVALGVGLLVLGEVPGPVTVLGGGIALIGVAVARGPQPSSRRTSVTGAIARYASSTISATSTQSTSTSSRTPTQPLPPT